MKTVFILIILFTISLFFMSHLVAEWFYKTFQNELEFAEKYKEIEDNIQVYHVCPENYQLIEMQIDELLSLKHKEPEMTDVLICNFRRRFGREYVKTLIA